MKKYLLIFFAFISLLAFGQEENRKHPRVTEVEEKLRDEAARYFARRYPGEAFFVRVDVNPLRRVRDNRGSSEGLPYFDAISEEDVDEWDDPTVPLSFLRHRVTKVTLAVSVPKDFTDEQLSSAREDLLSYLKLMPYRDEIRVERKLEAKVKPLLPPFFIPVTATVVGALIFFALLLRWSMGGRRSAPAATATAPVAAAPMPAAPASRDTRKAPARTSTDVRGDVNFHDPLKLMDVVRFKIETIGKSSTFPTLKDIITLDELGRVSPEKLGALIQAMPADWQKNLFSVGKGELWLEAFASPGSMDQDSLLVLDRLCRDRHFASGERAKEDLLIQLWRLDEKAVPFLRKLDQEIVFSLLNDLPKSISLPMAKKAFPGGWARLLDNRDNSLKLTGEHIRGWQKESELLYPKVEWKLLESYKKDREILSYLDRVTIEEEKDIYASLDRSSFVFQVRPAFYRVFELEDEAFRDFVGKFPLDKWALAVMNSSRNYIRQVTDALDDKKKVLFSNQLRLLDGNLSWEEQIQWRKSMAQALSEQNAVAQNTNTMPHSGVEEVEAAKSA